MSSYYMVMTVLNRNLEDEYINYFEKHNIVNFSAFHLLNLCLKSSYNNKRSQWENKSNDLTVLST